MQRETRNEATPIVQVELALQNARLPLNKRSLTAQNTTTTLLATHARRYSSSRVSAAHLFWLRNHGSNSGGMPNETEPSRDPERRCRVPIKRIASSKQRAPCNVLGKRGIIFSFFVVAARFEQLQSYTSGSARSFAVLCDSFYGTLLFRTRVVS